MNMKKSSVKMMARSESGPSKALIMSTQRCSEKRSASGAQMNPPANDT